MYEGKQQSAATTAAASGQRTDGGREEEERRDGMNTKLAGRGHLLFLSWSGLPSQRPQRQNALPAYHQP